MRLHELANRLSEAIDWADSENARLRRGRYGAYELTLQAANEWDAAGRQGTVPYRNQDYLAASLEGFLLTEVAASKDLSLAHGFRAKLRTMGQGGIAYHSSDHDWTDAGRDAAFELLVGSRFARSGFVPRFDRPADVGADLSFGRVEVECKRPGSRTKLGTNLSGAYRQHEGHRKLGFDGHAFVFLDVSRLINPDYGILEHPKDLAIGKADLLISDLLAEQSTDISHEANFNADIAAANVSGIVLFANFVTQTEGMMLFTSLVRPIAVPGKNVRPEMTEMVNLLATT